MIHISCSNCGWAVFGKAVIRVDTMSVDMTCPRCKAVYRVSAVLLHAGEPQDINETRKRKAYTYDTNHDRVALPDVQRQATDDK